MQVECTTRLVLSDMDAPEYEKLYGVVANKSL